LNPGYGEEGKGIYTKFSYSDVDFFLTDDRYFRSEPEMRDSAEGKPLLSKTFFGAVQMGWLQNSLLSSQATFKITVVGSQVLNPLNKGECMQAYPFERCELLDFLGAHKINRVFFSPETSIIRSNKGGKARPYPLYEVIISPYTAGFRQ
jgi:alkaline phosphatase D